ncbi:kinase-like domain-containing protein [Mycena filopes]|nr:kinase-like domain-containing protein [Mycena filopes]
MAAPQKEQATYILPTRTSLGTRELEWAHYQPFLEQKGYMLRPRYRPGWVAECLTPGKRPQDCEDGLWTGAEVLDATRMSDGAPVVLKMLWGASAEVAICEFLSKQSDPERSRNIPILEVIPMYDIPDWCFLVMPRMRPCHAPEFATIGEFTEFMEQVLEGLVFLHSKRIAHRDICTMNIVMDASQMVPNGSHFLRPNTSDGVHFLNDTPTEDGTPYPGPDVIKSRTNVAPMRYYYIDFGLSVHFQSSEVDTRVLGICGRLRKYIPEISETVPYDPFKVDVRLVGEMAWTELLEHYEGLDFMIPFVKNFRRRDPRHRPDAGKALALFKRLVSTLDKNQPITMPLFLDHGRRKATLFLKSLGLQIDL